MSLTRSHCERRRSTSAMACHRGHRRGWPGRPLAGGARAHRQRQARDWRQAALGSRRWPAERRAQAWPTPIAESIPAILAHRGEPVAVLASGDPYCFGVGSMLSAHVPAEETICIPAPSSLSLACALLGWALDDVATVSLCGRPIVTLAPWLQPKRRVLALSADATTPAAVARYLSARGFERSMLHVLEALGGPRERMRSYDRRSFRLQRCRSVEFPRHRSGSERRRQGRAARFRPPRRDVRA